MQHVFVEIAVRKRLQKGLVAAFPVQFLCEGAKHGNSNPDKAFPGNAGGQLCLKVGIFPICPFKQLFCHNVPSLFSVVC